jgi:hypothetical protein
MSSSNRKVCVARADCNQISTRTSRSVGIARRIIKAPRAFRAAERVMSLTGLLAYQRSVSGLIPVSNRRAAVSPSTKFLEWLHIS